MSKRCHLLSASIGLGFLSFFVLPAQAQVAQFCPPNQSEEECACDAALKANTLEALEEFLQRYPRPGDSACAARASELVFSEGDRGRKVEPVSGSPN
jgi:hypothetical protein